MKISIWEDEDDSTMGDFSCPDPLASNKERSNTNLMRPTAKPLTLSRFAKGKDNRIVGKAYPKSFSTYTRDKRIWRLVKQTELHASAEQHVFQLVQQYLELSLPFPRRLEIVVASAAYLVHRLNNSRIFLDQILEIYRVKPADISRCLANFKRHHFCQEEKSPGLFPLYQQLVDKWLPNSSEMLRQHQQENTEKMVIDFAMQPAKNLSESLFCAAKGNGNPPSARDGVIYLGRVIIELPETAFSKQGKKPQSVIAGIFLAVIDFFELQITPRDVSEKLGISYATVLESKKRVQGSIIEHVGKVRGDEMSKLEDAKEKAKFALKHMYRDQIVCK